MSDPAGWHDIGESAWAWVLEQVCWADDGTVSLPMTVDDEGPGEVDEFPDSTHSGIGGLAFALAEIHLARPWTTSEQRLATGIVATIESHLRARVEPSYGVGLAGDATALRLLDPGREEGALARLEDLAGPDGWGTTLFDAYAGAVTDLLLRQRRCSPRCRCGAVKNTPRWRRVRARRSSRRRSRTRPGCGGTCTRGAAMRCLSYSHGAAGVATALATAGHRLGRQDWIDAALQGPSTSSQCRTSLDAATWGSAPPT